MRGRTGGEMAGAGNKRKAGRAGRGAVGKGMEEVCNSNRLYNPSQLNINDAFDEDEGCCGTFRAASEHAEDII